MFVLSRTRAATYPSRSSPSLRLLCSLSPPPLPDPGYWSSKPEAASRCDFRRFFFTARSDHHHVAKFPCAQKHVETQEKISSSFLPLSSYSRLVRILARAPIVAGTGEEYNEEYEDIQFIPLHSHGVLPAQLQGLLYANAHGHLYYTH